jgi:hypothetical protein
MRSVQKYIEAGARGCVDRDVVGAIPEEDVLM